MIPANTFTETELRALFMHRQGLEAIDIAEELQMDEHKAADLIDELEAKGY